TLRGASFPNSQDSNNEYTVERAGVEVVGHLTLSDSIIENNTTYYDAGGLHNKGWFTATNVTIANNTGGSLSNASGGTVLFQNGVVRENTKNGVVNRGRMTITDSVVRNIQATGIRNRSGSAHMTLDRVAVSDLAALARLPELTRLSLENLPETDLSPLGELTQLETLSLRGNAWLTEAPLNNLHNLRSLNLANTGVTSLAGVEAMADLRSLFVFRTALTDLGPLGTTSSLTFLDISFSPVTSLAPLGGHTGLVQLWMKDTDLTSLAGLENAASLKVIEGDGTRALRDISALKAKLALETLNLNGSDIADLSPLGNATALRELGFNGSRVTDLTPLSSLTGLRDLKFKETQVTDISALGGMTQLRGLSLPQQDLDLSVLNALPRLSVLRAPDLPGVDMRPILALDLALFLPGEARMPLGSKEEVTAFIEARP
ncbi:MAG: hypothetical protein AAGI01_17775, partial [Myxococcota bacterium]